MFSLIITIISIVLTLMLATASLFHAPAEPVISVPEAALIVAALIVVIAAATTSNANATAAAGAGLRQA
jgi:hypothetical protein